MSKILVTGGLGYIGSHTAIELLANGYEVVVVDNLVNSKELVKDRIEKIAGKKITFYNADVRDKATMMKIFKENNIFGVIHFAGLKAVGESCVKPIEYYDNNLISTLVLVEVMRENECFNLIFSSSATVYGTPEKVPINEDAKTGGTTNPYGTTKLMIERMLIDLRKADERFNIVLLRYFNPIGAHKSGLIGEDPNGIPNNLMPYITQVGIGKLKQLNVFGGDYPTKDGTGVRDYIHVVDLASGHVCAIKKIEKDVGLYIYNLGTGNGYSVLDMVKAFEKASGVNIPYKIVARRSGDIAECYADSSKAKKEIGFKCKYGLDEMCRDSWNWQQKNPNGYNG